MVAIIHQSQSLNRIVNYNEQKVKLQKAVCLKAENYPKKLEDLRFSQKLSRLKNQASLNERTKVNAVHISLNFDPSEHLAKSTLEKIANEYMEKIGFGAQPYLIYQHNDAGHEHIHIVTTNIKSDGKRISLHNLGRNESEKARKEIEAKFGLVQAENPKVKDAHKIKPVDIRKAIYGKSETRSAIIKILNTVLTEYNYSSIPELNAVLMQYNIMADRGAEASRVFKNRGIIYRILNEKGDKVGVPIKASLLPGKPTLAFLEAQFIKNLPLRVSMKRHTKNTIDWNLLNNRISLTELESKLADQSIDLVIRQNKEGIIYGITYVDHKNKVVFNGSELGHSYSAKGILSRCNIHQSPTPKPQKGSSLQYNRKNPASVFSSQLGHSAGKITLNELLAVPNPPSEFVPSVRNAKKKRRKKPR
jgi:hypothetical protein